MNTKLKVYREYLEAQLSSLDLHLITYPRDTVGQVRFNQIKGDLEHLQRIFSSEFDKIGR